MLYRLVAVFSIVSTVALAQVPVPSSISSVVVPSIPAEVSNIVAPDAIDTVDPHTPGTIPSAVTNNTAADAIDTVHPVAPGAIPSAVSNVSRPPPDTTPPRAVPPVPDPSVKINKNPNRPVGH